ncbi:MAG: sunset domain-containing protein [Dehalococcoidia bacterium]
MPTETRSETRPAQRAISAWQDGLKALFGGYGRQTEQAASGLWNLRLDPEQTAGTMRRIADSTLAVAGAQLDVAREWLQAPYWATGLSSLRAFQESYGRLAQAYGSLFTAYIGAAEPIGSAVTQAATSAAATALPIKGNVSRDGQKIYHVQGQANYDRIEADALFETEADAVAAGYRPSLR